MPIKTMDIFMIETIKNFKRYVNISQFSNKNCVYMGYIETLDNLHYFKYGETSNIIERNKAHVKEFANFGLVYVIECKVSKTIENQLKNFLSEKKILSTFKSNTKIQTEIFTVKNNDELSDIIHSLEKLVNCEKNEKDKHLEYENELLKKDNEILQKEIQIKQLQLRVQRLRNKKCCVIL